MDLGVRLVLVESQVTYVHFPDRALASRKGARYQPIDGNHATVLRFDQSRDFLQQVGVDGVIVSTTSHSPDGAALVLASGDCFVGDLQPLELLAAYEGGNEALVHDWATVRRAGGRIAHIGHYPDRHIG